MYKKYSSSLAQTIDSVCESCLPHWPIDGHWALYPNLASIVGTDPESAFSNNHEGLLSSCNLIFRPDDKVCGWQWVPDHFPKGSTDPLPLYVGTTSI